MASKRLFGMLLAFSALMGACWFSYERARQQAVARRLRQAADRGELERVRAGLVTAGLSREDEWSITQRAVCRFLELAAERGDVLALKTELPQSRLPYETQAGLVEQALGNVQPSGRDVTAKVLLAPEPDERRRTLWDRAGLIWAAGAGRLDLVRRLLSRGAPIDGRDSQENTALRAAVLAAEPEIATFLIAQGADVNVRNVDGDTPLLHAIVIWWPDVVEQLVRAGADLNEVNQAGFTPLIVAIQERNREMARLLVRLGANVQ